MSQALIEFDFHTHSLLSDGDLVPAELARRFSQKGYRAVAIADHVDASNIEMVVPAIVKGARQWNRASESELRLIPGAEITHVPPSQIPALISDARQLGAQIVLVHGETLSEPVMVGTNSAAIEGGADVLSHPGLVSERDARRAAERGVLLEITARAGHCLTNGHVVQMARNAGALLVINSDAHTPADIPGPELAARVGLGAGLSRDDLAQISATMAQVASRSI